MTTPLSSSALDEEDSILPRTFDEAPAHSRSDGAGGFWGSRLDTALRVAIEGARNDDFTPGRDTNWHRSLRDLIDDFGPIAVDGFAVAIDHGLISRVLAREALREIGASAVGYGELHHVARDLLTASLSSESREIRDGAASGLADLNDRTTTHYLSRAIEIEESEFLKDFLTYVRRKIEAERGR